MRALERQTEAAEAQQEAAAVASALRKAGYEAEDWEKGLSRLLEAAKAQREDFAKLRELLRKHKKLIKEMSTEVLLCKTKLYCIHSDIVVYMLYYIVYIVCFFIQFDSSIYVFWSEDADLVEKTQEGGSAELPSLVVKFLEQVTGLRVCQVMDGRPPSPRQKPRRKQRRTWELSLTNY